MSTVCVIRFALEKDYKKALEILEEASEECELEDVFSVQKIDEPKKIKALDKATGWGGG